MTSAEAQGYADQYLPERWDPVVEELRKLEGTASEPEPPAEPAELSVAVTASPAHPLLNESVTLRAAISNAPSGSAPSYKWEIESDGEWHSFGSSPTLSFLADKPESWTFRVTVSYDTGDSVTSDPITVSWTETRPNRAPVVNTQAANHASFLGNQNAPRGVQVWKEFKGIFSDPDGDELTYAASVPADRSHLLDSLGISRSVSSNSGEKLDFVFILVDGDDDWKAASPALADPLTITVTLTATDPDGLSASINGDFVTNWDSSPALVSATANAQAVTLTFDQEVQGSLVPSSFTVNVANEDGTSAGTIDVSSVLVSGRVVTLELASALEKGRTVTLDYAHDDDTPLTRAAGGGDSASSFTGQAVAVSITDPPGSPQNFDLTATPGELDISATWDALDGATSYELRWRLNDGEYGADNTANATDTEATITVSGNGRWVVGLKGCNDGGCGPEAEATVDVGPFSFALSQARDEAGNPLPRTFDANWSPVPDASGYRLRWSRLNDGNSPPQAQPPVQAQGGPSKTKSDIPGPSGNVGPGANPQQENQINLLGDQTSAQFTVSGDGDYLVELEMYLNNRDGPVASYHGHVTARVTNPGNVVLFHQFDCATQSSKITGVYGQALDGGVRITWNTPAWAPSTSTSTRSSRATRSSTGATTGRTSTRHGSRPRSASWCGKNRTVAQPGHQDLQPTRNYAQAYPHRRPTTAGYTLTTVDIDLYIGNRQGSAPDFTVGIYSVGDDNRPHRAPGAAERPLTPWATGSTPSPYPGDGVRLEPSTDLLPWSSPLPTPGTGTSASGGRRHSTTTATGWSGWRVGDNHFRVQRPRRCDVGNSSMASAHAGCNFQGYQEPSYRYGYLQANALAGTTSFTLKGLENYSSYAILLRGVAGSSTRCFQKMVFVTPYQTTIIPAITGFDAYKGYGTGPRQVTLEWDDPDDETLDYQYFYTGVPVHWSGWRGPRGLVPGAGLDPHADR